MVDNAHYFSVEEMSADHNNAEQRKIFKGQKGEAAGPTMTSVVYDRASLDFNELGKVVSQSL